MKTIETIKAAFEANREEARAERKQFKADFAQIEVIFKDTRENGPDATVAKLVEVLGYDRAVEVVATMVNTVGDWDARVRPTVREWAKTIDGAYDEEAASNMFLYTQIHPCHIQQIAAEMMKADRPVNPDEPEQADINEAVAEEVEAELADNFTITENGSFGSIEISFTEKPSEAVRDALKAMRFRWHGQRRVWYGYRTEDEAKLAIRNAQRMERGKAKQDESKQSKANKSEAKKSGTKKPAAKKSEPVNDYGVKVGDMFYSSWGYEQTNVDFFQVVELVGKTSVRVREVNPPIIEDKTYQHGMAADRVYQTSGCGILEPAKSSVFIKDQVKGDLKRVKSYGKRCEDVQFNLSSFANAHLCGDKQVAYESWYY